MRISQIKSSNIATTRFGRAVLLLLGAMGVGPTLAATFTCTLEKAEFSGGFNVAFYDTWRNSDSFKPGAVVQVDTSDKGWRVTDAYYFQDNFVGLLANQIPIISSIDRETGAWWNIIEYLGDNNTGVQGIAKTIGHCTPRTIHPKL